tara:strand:- start:224 stop:409 length:186 start_codon:yes stop_codon:yes gene_type:complete
MAMSVKKMTGMPSPKKKTSQGCGKYTKTSHAGGETYYGHVRSGSPPGKAHRRKKPYRGQGR